MKISKLKKILHNNLPLLFLLVIALIIRLYKINELFPFDHDQEVPAQAAYDFFVFHKLSLIGQELSFQGFFLGPIHNWVQFYFMALIITPPIRAIRRILPLIIF